MKVKKRSESEMCMVRRDVINSVHTLIWQSMRGSSICFTRMSMVTVDLVLLRLYNLSSSILSTKNTVLIMCGLKDLIAFLNQFENLCQIINNKYHTISTDLSVFRMYFRFSKNIFVILIKIEGNMQNCYSIDCYVAT